MKDTLITAKRKKTELITIAVCFVLVNIANLYAVIAYHTPYGELFTSLGYVAVASAALYVAWTLVRLVVYGITRLIGKGKVM